MNRRRLALAAVVVAVLVPLGGLLWFESGIRAREAQRPEVGATFPALPGFADGETLPAAPGRLRIVTFARAGCGNCDRTITTLRRLNRAEVAAFDLIAVVAGAYEPEGNGDGPSLHRRSGRVRLEALWRRPRAARLSRRRTVPDSCGRHRRTSGGRVARFSGVRNRCALSDSGIRPPHAAAAGLLVAAGLVTVAARTLGPTMDRLAWAAALDPSAPAPGEVVRQQRRSDCGPAALKMVP